MLLPGLATFLLIGLVLINPFTEKFFILTWQKDMWKDPGIS